MSESHERGRCSVSELLDHWVATQPDKLFAVFDSGERWSYRDLNEVVRDTAQVLQESGVSRGDRVVTWLENGPLAVRVWLAVNFLGAVHVPMNTAYRGGLLEHALDLAEAEVIVAHGELVERLSSVQRERLRLVYATSGCATANGLEIRSAGDLMAVRKTDPTPAEGIRPWDVQMILYTSGTTGPSKAVMSSYGHAAAFSVRSSTSLNQDDRALIYTPLYHVTGISGIWWALSVGGSIGVAARFRTSTFWRDLLALQATFMVLMGSVARFLLNEPVTAAERETTLRIALITPLNSDAVEFAKRVGIDYYSVFNMTETSSPLVTPLNPEVLYSCGRPRAGMQVRLVDRNDIEVPASEVGELLVRSDEPWELASGYYRNDAATAASLRNGWFHTGDAMRRDEAGNFFYVDRVKDSIRRRGENISSYEVEVEVQAHSAVQEAAAVAVPSEFSEDDVMVFVVLQPRAVLDPAELIEFLRGRMAHFMVPRYVEVVDELPRTPTLKVQKAVLRERGSAQAWDREAAGIHIKKDVIKGNTHAGVKPAPTEGRSRRSTG